eukprot:CAMPEP_0181298250 /NCGR_PEP_ID=MMETSP1101-20121128/5682_1 /TAXON_ID=46948 /ORGANISM="Rhodomonas abbreviata, Strain Caron Lab Isolate" /LENGTH=395 /DNA_ID=CAMNT_0023403259 /DNA_START=150 /DNA_END=1338 /DNA_ORIENTATION=-
MTRIRPLVVRSWFLFLSAAGVGVLGPVQAGAVPAAEGRGGLPALLLTAQLPAAGDDQLFRDGQGVMSDESHRIVQGVAHLLNVKLPKLKDVATFAELRRASSEEAPQASPLSRPGIHNGDSFHALHWASGAGAAASFEASRRFMQSGPPSDRCVSTLSGLEPQHDRPLQPIPVHSTGSRSMPPSSAPLTTSSEVDEVTEDGAATAHNERKRRDVEGGDGRWEEANASRNARVPNGLDNGSHGDGSGISQGGDAGWNGNWTQGGNATAGGKGGKACGEGAGEGEEAWAKAEKLRELGEQMTRLAFRVAGGMEAEAVDRELAAMRAAMAGQMLWQRRKSAVKGPEEQAAPRKASETVMGSRDGWADALASQAQPQSTMELIRRLPPIEHSQTPAKLC